MRRVDRYRSCEATYQIVESQAVKMWKDKAGFDGVRAFVIGPKAYDLPPGSCQHR